MKKLTVFRQLILLLPAVLLLTGCADHGAEDETVTMPQTSVIERREAFLENDVAAPGETKTYETYIAFHLRPVFILHINNGNVIELEALNTEAERLRAETDSYWQHSPYEEAVGGIIEQCIIDGYISDNNPDVSIAVTGHRATEVRRGIAPVIEDVISLHGIDATVDYHDNATD